MYLVAYDELKVLVDCCRLLPLVFFLPFFPSPELLLLLFDLFSPSSRLLPLFSSLSVYSLVNLGLSCIEITKNWKPQYTQISLLHKRDSSSKEKTRIEASLFLGKWKLHFSIFLSLSHARLLNFSFTVWHLDSHPFFFFFLLFQFFKTRRKCVALLFLLYFQATLGNK